MTPAGYVEDETSASQPHALTSTFVAPAVRGTAGADVLDGGYADDQLFGLGGNDEPRGAFESDKLEGGGGRDKLSGGFGDDRLLGGRGGERLNGQSGDDTLSGSTGLDILSEGLGKDSLGGGSGADTFVFRSAGESVGGAGRDVIVGFQRGLDRIDLRGIDASVTSNGDQSFDFVGRDAFLHQEGELRLKGGVVHADVDGDGLADLSIEVTGSTRLSDADFTLQLRFPSGIETGSSVSADTMASRADVIDGDTIAIAGVEPCIRLHGIDAPEGEQTYLDAAGDRYLCGSRAADALASLIGRNGRVTCQEEARNRYGRVIAVCDANGMDLNAEKVVQGWSPEYRDYSDGRYSDEEAKARQAAQGLWAGEFDEPWSRCRGQRSNSSSTIQLAQRRSCKAVSSCEEPVGMWCGGYDGADGDDDGVPCGNVCSSVSQVGAIRGRIGC